MSHVEKLSKSDNNFSMPRISNMKKSEPKDNFNENIVAVMNKDLPEILQKWHEVSTLLRNNQTTTIIRLNELERITEKLRMNFTTYKSTLDGQNNFAKEEKIVAAFGAKIEAVITDMESFKDYYSGVVNKQIEMQTNLNDLSAKILDAQERDVKSTETSKNFSKEISVIKLYLRNDSTRVQDSWNELSQNLSLKLTTLHQNVQRNELQIAELMRHMENISMHIALVENYWRNNNIKIKDCQGLTHNIECSVTNEKNGSKILEQSITTNCNRCTQINTLQENSDEEYKQNSTISQKTKNVIEIH